MKALSEISIFLVDDDPFFLCICEKMLQNMGITKITLFLSSIEFLNNIQLNPDIILLDYNMDSLSGLDTLKKIKRFKPNSLVVFISGQDDMLVAASALKYGAFEYLIKNQVNEQHLKLLLERGMALKTMFQKNYKRTVLNRVLSTIGIPVLVWILLETFFK
jgi:DNA-binding NtrC family response regulator